MFNVYVCFRYVHVSIDAQGNSRRQTTWSSYRGAWEHLPWILGIWEDSAGSISQQTSVCITWLYPKEKKLSWDLHYQRYFLKPEKFWPLPSHQTETVFCLPWWLHFKDVSASSRQRYPRIENEMMVLTRLTPPRCREGIYNTKSWKQMS